MQDIAESRSRLRGFNIAVAPYQAEGVIDLSALPENIERVTHLGTDPDRRDLPRAPDDEARESGQSVRCAIDIAKDRVPVTLCSAASDPRVVPELTQLAGMPGSALMMTPPLSGT